MHKFSISSILILTVIQLSAVAHGVTLYGRVKLSNAPVKCSICLGCDYQSGAESKEFQCPEKNNLVNGVKYKISFLPQINSNGHCILKVVEKPVALSPAYVLPSYPNKLELQKRLSCKVINK